MKHCKAYHLIIIFLALVTVVSTKASQIAIANKADGTASFLDLKNGKINTVKVGYLPHEIVADKSFAYVANYGSDHVRSKSLTDRPGNSISVVNLSSYQLDGNISLGQKPCAPHGLFLSTLKNLLYVTCEARHEILVIDTHLKKVIKSVATNQAGSHMMVVDRLDRFAYIANFWIGTVSVIDLEKNKIIKQLSVGRGVEGIALSPDNQFLYLTLVEDNFVLKVDTKKNEVVVKAPSGEGSSPIRVVVSGDGKKLFVNNVGTQSLSIYSSETMKILKTIPVGRRPIGLAVSPITSEVYVANMLDGTISVINGKNMRRQETLKTHSKLPDGIALVE